MSSRIRNFFLILGTVLAVALLWLRVEGGLSRGGPDLGIFFEMLGYSEPKNYALLLLDTRHEPLLFVATVSKGVVQLRSVSSAANIMRQMGASDVSTAANAALPRIEMIAKVARIDAVGFITRDAAGEIADAFGGFFIDNHQVTSKNFDAIVSTLADSPEAMQSFNTSASIHKTNLFANGRSVLYAAKDVFSRGLAAVFFKTQSPFGKPCIGACDTNFFQYFDKG